MFVSLMLVKHIRGDVFIVDRVTIESKLTLKYGCMKQLARTIAIISVKITAIVNTLEIFFLLLTCTVIDVTYGTSSIKE